MLMCVPCITNISKTLIMMGIGFGQRCFLHLVKCSCVLLLIFWCCFRFFKMYYIDWIFYVDHLCVSGMNVLFWYVLGFSLWVFWVLLHLCSWGSLFIIFFLESLCILSIRVTVYSWMNLQNKQENIFSSQEPWRECNSVDMILVCLTVLTIRSKKMYLCCLTLKFEIVFFLTFYSSNRICMQ